MSYLLPFARAGAALYSVQAQTGVIGFDDFVSSMGRLVARLASNVTRAERSALDEMVQLARSRVPRDTGRLFNGISGRQEADFCEFRASAVHEDKPGSREDYARFVEFGTHPGQRGQFHEIVADTGFYSAPATLSGEARGVAHLQRRRSLRGHPGTDPQPFFFNSVEDVLRRRPVAMQHALDDAGRAEGFL